MSRDSDTIHIAVVVDDAFIRHCAVMALSLAQTLDVRRTWALHVFQDGLGDEARRALVRTVEAYPVSVEFHDVDRDRFAGLSTDTHISSASYYKFLIPEMLPGHIRNMLYLDCDMVVMRDLAPLYDTDVSHLGAVLDPGVALSEYYDVLFRTSRPGRYFNCGLLLMNLDRMREMRAGERMLAYARLNSHHYFCHDQTAFNWLFRDVFTPLHPKYNLMQCINIEHPQLQKDYEQGMYAEALEAPVVIHYTGSMHKPWLRYSIGRFTGEYRKLLAQTPYAGMYRAGDISGAISRFARQALIRYAPLSLLRFLRSVQRAQFMRRWAPSAAMVREPES